MAQKLQLTRKQLETISKDPVVIKQLERLFEVAGSVEFIVTGDLSDISPINTPSNSTRTDYIDFPVNGPHVSKERRLQWNRDDGTIDVGLFNGVILQVGQEMHHYVKNTSGVTISNGNSVMVTGAVGASGKLTVAKAVSDGTYASDYMLGIATQDIADQAFGYVTTYGKVRGFNTSGSPYGETWADGDVLYFNPTVPGGLTNIEPVSPAFRSKIAIVVNAAGGGAGDILVRMSNGSYLHDLQDVKITSLTENEALNYNASNGLWENVPFIQIPEVQTRSSVTIDSGFVVVTYGKYQVSGSDVLNVLGTLLIL